MVKTKVCGKLSPKGTFECPQDKTNLWLSDRTLEALDVQTSESHSQVVAELGWGVWYG